MAICEKCGREIPEGSVCECENEISDALTPADDNNISENTSGSMISLAKESDSENSASEATAEEAVSETSTASEEVQAESTEPEIKEEAAETAEPAAEVKETPAPEVKETPAAEVKEAPEVKAEKKETVKAETAEQTSVTPAQKKGFIKKNLKVIIPVAAALAAVIGITGYVSANAYKKPVNQFAKAYNSNNVDQIINTMLPKDSIKEMKKNLKEEDTSWKEVVKEMNDTLEEAKEDKYGKNAKMEITYINKYKAKKDEISKNSSVYSMVNTDEEIDKAYRVKLRTKIEGKDDSESERHELYVVHFDKSGWKLSPYMNDIDDTLYLSNMFY